MATYPKPTPTLTDEQMIRAIPQEFNRYHDERNIDKLVNLYTDGRIMAPFRAVAQGKTALRDSFQRDFDEFDQRTLKVDTTHVEVFGDIAFSIGSYKVNLKIPTGKRIDDQGKTATNSLPTAAAFGTMVVFGGHIYWIDGDQAPSLAPNSQTTGVTNVYYASAIRGVVGTWTLNPNLTIHNRAKGLLYTAYGQVISAEGVYTGNPGCAGWAEKFPARKATTPPRRRFDILCRGETLQRLDRLSDSTSRINFLLSMNQAVRLKGFDRFGIYFLGTSHHLLGSVYQLSYREILGVMMCRCVPRFTVSTALSNCVYLLR